MVTNIIGETLVLSVSFVFIILVFANYCARPVGVFYSVVNIGYYLRINISLLDRAYNIFKFQNDFSDIFLMN